MDRFLNVIMAMSIALILWVLFSVRRSHIRVEYSVSWLGAALVLFTLTQSGPVLYSISAAVGFQDPPMAILFLTFLVFLGVFYRFSMIISELKDANVALTQRLAILEYRLRSSHENEGK